MNKTLLHLAAKAVWSNDDCEHLLDVCDDAVNEICRRNGINFSVLRKDEADPMLLQLACKLTGVSVAEVREYKINPPIGKAGWQNVFTEYGKRYALAKLQTYDPSLPEIHPGKLKLAGYVSLCLEARFLSYRLAEAVAFVTHNGNGVPTWDLTEMLCRNIEGAGETHIGGLTRKTFDEMKRDIWRNAAAEARANFGRFVMPIVGGGYETVSLSYSPGVLFLI